MRQSLRMGYRGAALAALALGGAALGCGGSEPTPQTPEVVMTEPPPGASSAPPDDAKPADTAAAAADAKPEAANDGNTNTNTNTKTSDSGAADAKPSGGAGAAKANDTSDTAAAGASLEGKLVSRAGSLIVIDVAGASPSPGTKGVLYRHFEQDIGPLHTTGWLAIADVTVKDTKGGKIRLDLVAEKSVIMLNGKKVNHFEAGNEVKLELSK